MSFLKIFFSKKGAAMLPVVMALGGIVIESVAVMSFMSYTLGQAGLGERLSSEAFAAARSGAIDAVRRVIRDKDFYNSGGYNLTVGEKTATITVVKDFPEVGKTRIISTGTALFRQRKVVVDLKINSITGQVDVVSFEEGNL
jgi:hypothetical protein